MYGFHNLATPNIKLEQTMNIAFNDINDIKLNVDINIVQRYNLNEIKK
jgi:hypothetical protein